MLACQQGDLFTAQYCSELGIATVHLNVRNFPILGFSHQFFCAEVAKCTLHLQPTCFWRFLDPRACKRPHRLHWQAIFRVAYQQSTKEQPHRRRRSWEASTRSDAAKPVLQPRLGVTHSSTWLGPVGRSPLVVLALQASIPDP